MRADRCDRYDRYGHEGGSVGSGSGAVWGWDGIAKGPLRASGAGGRVLLVRCAVHGFERKM